MKVRAIVAKRDTEDGTEFLLDEVPIGFVYEAELASIVIAEWYNTETAKKTARVNIHITGSATGKGNLTGIMPLELFRLEPASSS